MQINKEIHTAITVAYRYAILHEAAKQASDAIGYLKLNTFKDSVTEGEYQLLKAAQKICEKIRSNTSAHDVSDYLKTLEDETITN